MPRPTLKVMKSVLMPGVFVAALAALIGFQTTGVAASSAALHDRFGQNGQMSGVALNECD